MELISKTPENTEQIAIKVLKETSKDSRTTALVIALEGELGAGKTVFTQGFAKALGIDAKITSPTFVLMKQYPIPHADLPFRQMIHIDAYRLKDHKDLEALGVEELIQDPSNILLIEWSDRVQEILPEHYIKIHIDHLNEHERNITITY